MSKYYCKECGKEIEKGLPVCPYCGAALGKVMGHIVTTTQDMKPNDVNNKTMAFYSLDNGAFSWIVIGLLLPPVGILLYLLRRKKSQHAKAGLAVAIISLVLVGGLAGYFRLRNAGSFFNGWMDYSGLIGKSRSSVEEYLQDRNQGWAERDDGSITLLLRESIEVDNDFAVTFWFTEDDILYGVTKDYSGKLPERGDFILKFYKRLEKHYGTPDQPPAEFKHDTWEQFYDGMVSATTTANGIDTEVKSLLAVWKDKNVFVTFEVKDGRAKISYNMVRAENWPEYIP